MSDKHRNAAIRAATKAYVDRLLIDLLPPIREAAHELGYAVAVHGSLADDIDLIAVPWVAHAKAADDLAKAISGAIAGVVGHCAIAQKTEGVLHGSKPHGRRAYTLMLHPLSYIDLSVTAREQVEI